jgi:hypothetical protein
MIQGYPVESSGYPGDSFSFCVSTDAPQFRIDFYRQGASLDFKTSTGWMPGIFADDHDATQDWGLSGVREDGKLVDGWASYSFAVPVDWNSGVYIAMFVEGDGEGNPNLDQEPPLDTTTADAKTGKALFVIKNRAPGVSSQMLYKIPLFTYQMYNMSRYVGIDGLVHAASGYGFRYAADPANPQQLTTAYDSIVTLRRPGGGTGGTPWDSQYFPNNENNDPGNWDPLDPASYRQTFVHWDARMVRWLETNGYRVDYCTDLDIDLDSELALLSPYSVVLSVGHDEYYSTGMRDNLETYISNGGNIAFFSGNTSYWKLEFPRVTADGQPDLTFIGRFVQWAQVPSVDAPTAPNRPEDSLTGVRFGNAGERNDPLPSGGGTYLGFTVQYVDRWPFEGSGLKENDTFGKDACIVGYECDGTPYPKNGQRPVSPTFELPSTPPGLVILGAADTSVWPGLPNSGYPLGNKGATMAIYQRNGTVFTGATTDWPRVLESGDAFTAAITRNVINRFGGLPKGRTTVANYSDIVACDAFFSPDDNYRHAVVGTEDGSVWEVFFNPTSGIGRTKVADIPGLVDICSFFTPDDKYRHILVASSDGTLWEVFFNPATGIGQANLGNYPGITRIAGFFSNDDGFRHVIIATENGDISEVFFNPADGEGLASLGSFNDVVDVAGFFSPDDNYRHAIVATSDGNIREIFFNPTTGSGTTLLGVFPNVVKISAFYAAGDSFFSRRVIVLTSSGVIFQIKYSSQAGSIRTVLMNSAGIVDVGGLFSNDDGDRHVIIAMRDGDLQELFLQRPD